MEITGSDTTVLKSLGITLHGRDDCLIGVLSKENIVGDITIHNAKGGNSYFFGNSIPSPSNRVMMRIAGPNATVVFSQLSLQGVTIPELSMRSPNQTFFLGRNATAVWAKFEAEGCGRAIVIGDDCMLSAGVWIRNHDMHAVFDTDSGDIINHSPCDVIIEQHVWIGFEAFVLGAERVGYGSIIGARSLLRESLPEKCLAAGIPARIIRKNVSWSRDPYLSSEATRAHLERLARI